MLEKNDNAALFLQFVHQSIVIYHKNGAFQKCSSNEGNLRMLAFKAGSH